MGDMRLGNLPRTRRWQEVIDLVAGNGSSAAIAAATLDAAEQDLTTAASDAGLLHTFWLLTQIPDAARSSDFVQALRGLDLVVSDTPSAAELTAAFTDAIDRHVDRQRARTDLGEMAQLAAVETVSAALHAKTADMFEPEAKDAQREIGKLATDVQFGRFARDFFARFSQRFLTYYVSRELPRNTGEGRRFSGLNDQRQFNEALELHCRQASKIVEKFAGGWYSKTRYEKGLTKDRTARFVGYAFKKLRSELRRGPPK